LEGTVTVTEKYIKSWLLVQLLGGRYDEVQFSVTIEVGYEWSGKWVA
jgi:hypothetical protein